MSAIRQPLAARRGFTLVELLVGLALALLVVAGGGALLTSQIRDHRALVLEARLMQDLRTAADLVARDLRRAGYWGDAGAGVWSADAAPRDNPYAALAPDDAASDAASLRYSRDTAENHVVDSNEQFGFRLRNRAIEIQLGSGNWQALTDATLLAVTEFVITPQTEVMALGADCPTPCPDESESCPRQRLASFALDIRAHALADAAVSRTVRALVRVRNDATAGTCPA
ncbi:MAG: prepilin-type N-terminal cleavage/methylation domain-containing protein [Burkholderiaceae bacterium]|nr:prepilin-type N-terminal cleavage/methylation domain-containing protein [Burkholderiaceae bacterium]